MTEQDHTIFVVVAIALGMLIAAICGACVVMCCRDRRWRERAHATRIIFVPASPEAPAAVAVAVAAGGNEI